MDETEMNFKTVLGFLRENLVVISVVLILLGYYDRYLFYQNWGIDIYPYIDVSEIIFTFSNVLAAAVLYVVPFLFMLMLSPMMTASFIKNEEKSSTVNIKERVQKRIARLMLVSGFSSLAFILVTIFLGLLTIYKTTSELNIIIFYLSVFFTLVAFCLFWDAARIVKNMKANRKVNHINFHFISLAAATCFLLYITTKNRIAYSNIMDGNPKNSISFSYESITIKSSNARPYIGSTKGYIFLYDTTAKIVEIYPERDAKFLSIKMNRKGI